MSKKTENKEPKVETVAPSMQIEKATIVLTPLLNFINSLIKTDSDNYGANRMLLAINDTLNIPMKVNDEIRHLLYQGVRNTAKVYGFIEHLPQRIASSQITENQVNYNAQTALTVQVWFDNSGMPPAQYRRPAHVDKDKGEVTVARNYDQENWIARILNDFRRSDGNQYDADTVYQPVTNEAQNEEVEG